MPDGSSNLLHRFREGDLEAFEALFREYERPVYGWILRMVRNAAAAEDLTVETFWRMHRARARFEPERPFGPGRGASLRTRRSIGCARNGPRWS